MHMQEAKPFALSTFFRICVCTKYGKYQYSRHYYNHDFCVQWKLIFACGGSARLEPSVCQNRDFFVQVRHRTRLSRPHGKIKNQNKKKEKTKTLTSAVAAATVVVIARFPR